MVRELTVLPSSSFYLKVYRTVIDGHTARLRENRKVANFVEREQKRANTRMSSSKNVKNTQLKSKKLMREVSLELLFVGF